MTVRMSQRTRAAALLTAALIVLPLSACAPEPGTGSVPEEVAGSGGKDTGDGETDENGAGWGEQDAATELPKATTLPDSFPKDRFAVPDGAVIDDAGERTETSWFVVLRAAEAATADVLWQAIIVNNELTAGETVTTAEGGVSAQLSGAGVTALGMTIPQPDGSVLLSYDVETTPAG